MSCRSQKRGGKFKCICDAADITKLKNNFGIPATYKPKCFAVVTLIRYNKGTTKFWVPSAKTLSKIALDYIMQREGKEKKIRFPKDFVKKTHEYQELGKGTGECADEKRRVGFQICTLARAKAIGPRRDERRAVGIGHARKWV
ncbi:uncharacterized protein LOC116840942 isoform X2 [Odontomachus brunneus]|uniref:uncharacterized protein LOC116840942 isoform X2 n=1 Tax=Odontomachus brunneus TaxID=486640 RepID=UPI0013F27C6C|nr:uncharacterized protein LOC116840942 isoform X2 [Odontomachus brunneus]